MEHCAVLLNRSGKRSATLLAGALAVLTCAAVAETANAVGDPEPLVAVAGDNSGPGGGGGGDDDSSTSTDDPTSSTDNSSSSTDNSSSSSAPGGSSSTPGTGGGSAPGTQVTFPEGSWEALALAPCAGQTGDPELAAALLEALDPTGATERDRGSRRLPLLVERCAVTFVGDVVPELGRPLTWFEQIVNDDVIVLPGDTTNDVTPNDAQLALLEAAATDAFPTCTPQPQPATDTTEAGSSVSTPSTDSTAPTSGSDATGAGSSVVSSATESTPAASNRCVVPPTSAPTASSEPATGTTVVSQPSSSAPDSTVPGSTGSSSSSTDSSTSTG